MRVWLPAIHGGSGVDVHTRRLALALQGHGVDVQISWFSTYYQFVPFSLAFASPPPGTNVIHVQKSFAAASAVTAVSQATALSLAHTVNLQSAQIIPNFVNTQIFRLPTGTPKSSKIYKLLFVGNLTRRKGADLLPPIMRQLGDRFELRFTTGLRDGSIRNIPTNMKSIGRLTEDLQLVNAYQECDALLFPSRLEGLPMTPLEAMACGKPVIAARASSMPEVIEHGTTGLLCEPDNVNQFVEACRTLADSPKTRQQYGDAARERVERLFSEDVIVPQYIALYKSLIDKKTG